MHEPPETASWFGSTVLNANVSQALAASEFERLWRAFMTARATLGLVLVVLQAGLTFTASTHHSLSLIIAGLYFTAALAVRLKSQPQYMGHTFNAQWLRTVGVDLMAFSALQVLQSGNVNYALLLTLPVLMAAILGSLIMAMGTAAGVTLLLFAHAFWMSLELSTETTSLVVQAALTGAGCFAISFMANQLATRLASVERKAQHTQLAVTVQRQVNELVIATLNEGVLVVDDLLWVRSANPAALALLGLAPQPSPRVWQLTEQTQWQALVEVVQLSHQTLHGQQADLSFQYTDHGPRHLRVRTQITPPLPEHGNGLCVVFMQDQREIQARVRSEKLASMGRMSAAVAHEIRNPLAAIVQANALLAEDLKEASQLRMTEMIRQNAQRLEKIVRDVLHLAHAPQHAQADSGAMLNLAEDVLRICRDWQRQNSTPVSLSDPWPQQPVTAWFDAEHLRRIVVNLLDNARRFCSGNADAIQVNLERLQPQQNITLTVWSDGKPLEPAVEQHLFEPFFSSDSRSSGLGLYICRELCQSHGASMSYERKPLRSKQQSQVGNAFSVSFCAMPPESASTSHTTSAA